MSKHISRQLAAEQAIVHDSLAVVPEADRSFNLPTGLYVVTAGLYFSFLGVLATLYILFLTIYKYLTIPATITAEMEVEPG